MQLNVYHVLGLVKKRKIIFCQGGSHYSLIGVYFDHAKLRLKSLNPLGKKKENLQSMPCGYS